MGTVPVIIPLVNDPKYFPPPARRCGTVRQGIAGRASSPGFSQSSVLSAFPSPVGIFLRADASFLNGASVLMETKIDIHLINKSDQNHIN
ncbi:hypothetical protein OIU89_16925 [Escherichia coli]|nr:hypothetical protein [Escherichia coli]